LHPSDALQAAAVDAAVCAESDAFAAAGAVKYRDRSGLAHLEPAAIAQAEKALNDAILPRHLGYLEAQLAASATGWICSTGAPAACDFAWGTTLRDISVGGHPFLKKELLDAVPLVRAFVARFLAIPEVSEYYARHA
jgi:hypothetical protein